MHAGHEELFRPRFFVSLVLSLPVLLYSETVQEWLGFSVPAFPGNEWIGPVSAVIVFAYGGVPFLRMAVPERFPSGRRTAAYAPDRRHQRLTHPGAGE